MADSLDLPRAPFHVRDLPALGLTRHRLRLLVAEGVVRRLGRGVYVAADVPDSIELRARAVMLVSPAGHVICDRSAAWIHGVDTLTSEELDVMPDIDTCAPPDGKASKQSGVDGHNRDLLPRDVMTVDGIPVTTPLRTALDLGCRLHRKDALAAMDAICRRHGITANKLRRELARFRGRRGVIQLRTLVPIVDPRSESARESWTRLAIHDAGFAAPDAQHWIVVDGVRRFRLDLAYPRRRIAIEYDGFDFHRRTKQQIAADAARRKWLRENGWTVIVIRVGDFSGAGLDRWIAELREALRSTYTNVRRLERGDRARLQARLDGRSR